MRITLSGGAPPTEQIRDQLRGLIASGQLAADQRLPSVRQLAADLGVSPGTVGKAYRSLEVEGLLVTRIGAGTRVAKTAAATPRSVLDAARQLHAAGVENQLGVEDAVRILRAIWNE